jgi:hypothetical protein
MEGLEFEEPEIRHTWNSNKPDNDFDNIQVYRVEFDMGSS